MNNSPVLGIDVGGTKILAVVALPDGTILSADYRPTPSLDGPEAGIEAMARAAAEAARLAGTPLSGISGAGIAMAGLVDELNGLLLVSPNLPKWNNVSVVGMLRDRLSLPCLLVNDANAAALGELKYGAGRGERDLIFITVSTGIGGGIVIDGRLYTGATGIAGEVGHMTVDPNGPLCGCGNSGCWEAMASGTAIARMALESLAAGRPSILTDPDLFNVDALGAHDVFEAARRGDGLAGEVISRAAFYLGIGLANLVNIFDPAMFVIGGGVSKEWETIIPPAQEIMSKRAFKRPGQEVRLARAALGDDAGALGAIALVLEQRR